MGQGGDVGGRRRRSDPNLEAPRLPDGRRPRGVYGCGPCPRRGQQAVACDGGRRTLGQDDGRQGLGRRVSPSSFSMPRRTPRASRRQSSRSLSGTTSSTLRRNTINRASSPHSSATSTARSRMATTFTASWSFEMARPRQNRSSPSPLSTVRTPRIYGHGSKPTKTRLGAMSSPSPTTETSRVETCSRCKLSKAIR